MATNTFRPTSMRTGVSTNVAATALTPVPAETSSVYNAQTVYEWYDYSSQWKTNPPFTKGSAGSILPSLHVSGGEQAPRILRGFIRRAEYSINDDASMSRLYMMYNPETISRDYMNYLDQGALDPFNTVFQSGNLVAPPSMLNFSFEMFFDRQEEAMVAGNRGVMVDMDYFDLVVRNVKTGGAVGANNALPDNGIMMVNPRDIAVIFSPELTVQGRPLNASVTYERFTHRMVPTRMRINLQMRVVYFGPQREITTFVPETVRALESIPFPISDPKSYTFDYKPLVFEGTNEAAGSNGADGDGDGDDSGGGEDVDPGAIVEAYNLHPDLKNVPTPVNDLVSVVLNRKAASQGWSRANQTQRAFDGHTSTQYGGEDNRTAIWRYVDCSSFVWACYAELGYASSLGWEKWPGNPSPTRDIDEATLLGIFGAHPASTANMIDGFGSNDNICRRLWGWGTTVNSGQVALTVDKCTPGDLLLRKKKGSKAGHVAFVWAIDKTAGVVKCMHAGSASMDIDITTHSGDNLSYDYAVRPFPKAG